MKRITANEYRKLRPEQALEHDLHGLILHGWDPGGVHEKPKVRRSAHRSPYNGSPNHTLRAIAVAAALGEDVRDECAALLALFDQRGHMLAEWCSPNYGYHQLEPLVVIVAEAADPDHPATEILRRQLLLWSVLARPIIGRARNGRIEYRGYGWRAAGLRGTPNNWGGWLDSMIAARALQLPEGPTGLGARRHSEAFNVSNRADVFVALPGEWQALRTLATGDVQQGSASVLRSIAKGIRTPDGMGAILARDIETGDTFCCMTGARKGGNTGATWAVHCTGPELQTHRVSRDTLRVSGDCDIAFPWRRANRKHVRARVRRNYRGKPNYFQQAGPVLGRFYHDRSVFQCENRDYSVVSTLVIPGWVWDDARAIRLDVTDEGATLNLPRAA